jgi:hypothetical protein
LPNALKKLLLPFCCTLILLATGCYTVPPAQKPDIGPGPAGKPAAVKPNPPFFQRFLPPPPQLYDLETTAGKIFSSLTVNDWQQVDEGISTFQSTWEKTKTLTGAKKGVADAQKNMEELKEVAAQRNSKKTYQALNKTMYSVEEIAKSYKLSPLSDLIAVGISLRRVSYYVETDNWKKASAKMKELEGVWHQAKPSLEQVGILGELTKAHGTILKLKDAIDAEDRNAFEEEKSKINESLIHIRQFYHGR